MQQPWIQEWRWNSRNQVPWQIIHVVIMTFVPLATKQSSSRMKKQCCSMEESTNSFNKISKLLFKIWYRSTSCSCFKKEIEASVCSSNFIQFFPVSLYLLCFSFWLNWNFGFLFIKHITCKRDKLRPPIILYLIVFYGPKNTNRNQWSGFFLE